MGCVTHSVPPYPPPPYNPRAYPAGPGGALDCRTADEKTAARLDEMGAALRRLEGEVAALRGEMRQLGAGRVSWETPVASTEGEPYEDG